MNIKARDVAPFVCGSGLKHFCAANGLDYQVMLREGYPADVLLASGDVNCQRVIRQVKAATRVSRNGQ